MASFSRLPSGLWRVQVARQGVRKSATFATKQAARIWATELEAELMASKHGGYPKKTVAQALKRYAEEVSPTKRGERWEVLRLEAFQRERWSAKWLTDLTSDDLGKWRDQRLLAVSGESIRRDFGLLSAVFSVARKEWRWMGDSPLTDVRKPPAGKARTRIPTWREIRRICRAAGYVTGQAPTTRTEEVAHVLLLSLRTAMRRGEILALTAADVDLDGRVAHLRMTKNGDARDVPLSARAVRLLRPLMCRILAGAELTGKAEKHLPNQRCIGGAELQVFSIAPASLDALWRRLCVRAGVDGLHLHDARAAALTSMSRKVDVLTLARISGHRNLNQLNTYYRISAADIAKLL